MDISKIFLSKCKWPFNCLLLLKHCMSDWLHISIYKPMYIFWCSFVYMQRLRKGSHLCFMSVASIRHYLSDNELEGRRTWDWGISGVKLVQLCMTAHFVWRGEKNDNLGCAQSRAPPIQNLEILGRFKHWLTIVTESLKLVT